MNTLAVMLGGAIGALLRYQTVQWLGGWFGRGFPWGTFTVNVVGSLLMGYLFFAVQRWGLPPWQQLALTTGLLGAFTTFSAFSVDALQLLQSGQVLKAVLYMLLSVSVCLLAAALGMKLNMVLATLNP